MGSIHLARHGKPAMRTLLLPASLLALGIVPVVAGVVRLAGLASRQVAAADVRFLENPLPVTLHLLAVIPYALLGALQFAPALRRRGWHRAVGTALVPLGMIAAVTGLWMTLFYPWPKGDGEAVYLMRLIVGVAMIFAIVRGVASLRHREYVAHGAWMLRGYALGMGAGTQVITHLPWFVFVGGTPDETSRAVMMGVAWVINAIVAEYLIRSRLAATDRVRPAEPRPVLVSTTI